MSKPSPSGIIRQDEPQILYRFWHNEVLLYVGISQSFLSRMDQHQTTKEWFGFLTHITVEHFANRKSVEVAEKLAIKQEQPIFNIVHNKTVRKNKARIDELKAILPSNYFYELPSSPQERKVFIDSLRSKNNGFSRVTLEKLGVPWPPPKAWRSKLIQTGKYIK